MAVAGSNMEFPVEACGLAGERLKRAFESAFLDYNALKRLPIELSQSLILSGKGTLIVELCRQFALKPVIIDSARLSTEFPAQPSRGLYVLIKSCLDCEAAVVLFHNIHNLFPAKGTDDEIYHELTTALDLIKRSGSRILVLATTSRIADIHPAVLKYFENKIMLELPTPSQRAQLLQWLIMSRDGTLPIDVNPIAQRCHAYTMADLSALCRTAQSHARARRSRNVAGEDHAAQLTYSDFMASYSSIRVSAAHHNHDVTRMEMVRWADIGGHRLVKELLHESVVWFYRNAEAFQRLGIRPSKGVLLYGPPGTGKTLLGKAVATESGANFLSISIADLIKGEVGESEKAIAKTFETARRCSPCVVFMDELEALFSRHDQMGDVGKKLFSQLIIEIDALDWTTSQVVLLCATNHPQCLDPSLLRPGRIDRLVAVRPPSKSERIAILKTISSQVTLHSDVQFEEIALRTRGKTGADLKELLRRASLAALSRSGFDAKPSVQMCDFSQALESPQFT
ncbi:hypothetical protein PhCBS80983_g00716 [Powellomyces hirtus]|uniref:AAA+ ATPase domain-containing protein n=1 Tax=Powellomyces hirtus TaxID=109895 RepID=A0A507EFS7_9FUNG|nr:hypothetical protein PhCBS80983_g00716 [Powellomyces hirtus]